MIEIIQQGDLNQKFTGTCSFCNCVFNCYFEDLIKSQEEQNFAAIDIVIALCPTCNMKVRAKKFYKGQENNEF
jgi:hypothetical protein